jgi:hypothetical protein
MLSGTDLFLQQVHLVKHHWWKNLHIFFMQLLEYLDEHLSPIGWKSSCRGASFLQSKVESVGEQSQSPMKGFYRNISHISKENNVPAKWCYGVLE